MVYHKILTINNKVLVYSTENDIQYTHIKIFLNKKNFF